MLSRADSELARRDEALAGLATLLDADEFANALRSARPGDAVESAELAYLRYKPATNCVATYRVRMAGASRLFYAKAHGPDAATKLAKARSRSPALLLGDRGISVFAFPHDAKLRSLGRLEDPARRSALLARVLRGSEDDGAALELLGYKPERRCVARLGPGGRAGAVLKFYALEGFPTAARSSKAFESRSVLRLARRCGGSKRHRVLAFEWLGGRALREAWADPEPRLAAASVGSAIAELHAQEGAQLPRRLLDDRLAELRELAATLAFLCPSLADRASRLAARIAARLAAGEEPLRAIHGDLYDKQILIDSDRVAILDLDRAARGDPRSDLGLFLAHLERDGVQGRLSAAHIEEISGWLLDGYQAATRARVADLGTHVAEGLLRLAHHPFRGRDPEWPRATQRILARAEELLAGPP